MLKFLFRLFATWALRRRYRLEVTGLDEIRARGAHGIVFLPCHPAFIDPVIVFTTLLKDFSPHTIADSHAVGAPGIKQLTAHFGVRTIPSVARYGEGARDEVQRVLAQVGAELEAGDNVLLYPSGRLMTANTESVGANSAVETLLRHAPHARVVLLRTRGLWGSSFSTAPYNGLEPSLVGQLLRGFGVTLANLFAFVPKRRVTLAFAEPADFPRGDRAAMNRALEAYYNFEPLEHNTFVPYYWWQGSTPQERPEPSRAIAAADLSVVPPATRMIVLEYLQKASGLTTIPDGAELARDLNLDSLARAELLVWLESEFGAAPANTDALRTVADVLLAASGEAVGGGDDFVHVTVPVKFFTGTSPRRAEVPPAATVAEAFLRQAAAHPGQPIIADQTSGVKTYRDLITGVFALLPAVRALPGDAVGIMLPASVAANVAYLTVLFAGKTPVMINWTVGARNLQHTLGQTGTQRIITAAALLARLGTQGIDLGPLKENFVPLETLAAGLSTGDKLRAALAARTHWGPLWKAPVSPVAAILSTSGSESLPKAVPLTHDNVLTNLRDVTSLIHLTDEDRLLGMLPPFHSFGLTANMLLALCAGVRTAYHTNPTEGALLARLIDAYRITLLLGTPTFLYGILRAAAREQLGSLRLAVTGAEECPPRVYTLLAERAPQAKVLEGYGVTEGSPIVSLNDFQHPKPGTIGRILPSLEYAIVDVESNEPAAPGKQGMLLLRGPSIFGGYLGDAPSPFVEFQGKQWYRTGDLVTEDTDGVLTFRGRLKRFVKIGGEMISLPAIEAVLQTLAVPAQEEEGPAVAVVATENTERPELVLFTTRPITRDTANAHLRDAGLSGLSNLRRVVPVESIPVLGTGKTDYRALQGRLKEMGEA
jgi:long-chain-fatty-acid--[acyl-carrier-protein] ligase